jgi:superfamily II DNA helicase RecQ
MNMGTIGGWRFAMSLVSMQLSSEERIVIEEMRRTQRQFQRYQNPFPLYPPMSVDQLLVIAKQYEGGISNFRPGQVESLNDLLRQKDCITIIPTGGGKSLIWLLLAVIGIRNDPSRVQPLPLAIVIVPFKATIESHFEKYKDWGLSATSNETVEILRQKIANCCWLYCTPEKIVKNEFFKSFIQGQAHRIR